MPVWSESGTEVAEFNMLFCLHPHPNIRHAATAMTGVDCSVASTIWAFLCSRHAAKKRHVDRTVSRCPQFCERGGKLRSVDGMKNGFRKK